MISHLSSGRSTNAAPGPSEAVVRTGKLCPPRQSPAGGPTLMTAIQQQLGLRMDSGTGPVEIIVIDHVERPSGN